MSWLSINEQLNKNLIQKGIKKKVDEFLVITLANELIEEIWGIELQQKVRVIYFKNNILVVAILSDVIEEEFKFHKDNFIKKINNKLGNNVVKNLRFLS